MSVLPPSERRRNRLGRRKNALFVLLEGFEVVIISRYPDNSLVFDCILGDVARRRAAVACHHVD